jgi:hypothetical protein
LRHFVLKQSPFYQDRLGTSIGKALERRGAFSSGHHDTYMFGAHYFFEHVNGSGAAYGM